jgi:clan AA aspartic protease (TIGR02281 family)
VTDTQAKLFLEKALQTVSTYSAELQEIKIPVSDSRHGHAVVAARFNDKYEAKLLVDTGASYVSLPIAIAKRLKLDWDETKKAKATLADGSKIDVYPTTIRRLTVAGATLENVPAIIMPDSTTSETDGLLGMSFLREFDIQIDSVSGEICLRRLPLAK